ncbi:MAG TPA: hypothetical protein PLN61_16660, partial [bacterium]|nr:hypothetical protein [bacterium]
RRVQAMVEVVKAVLGITLKDWGDVPEDERLRKTQASGKLEGMQHSRAAAEMARIVRQRLLVNQ